MVAARAELPLAQDVAGTAAERFARLARHGRTMAVGESSASVRWSVPMLTLASTEPVVLRVTEGIHAALFDKASRSAFLGERWQVANESNRMGYRLSGPRLALRVPREIASQGVCFGTVQVPAGGQPIVLMADRQTTGGYPRIAEIITADVPRLAQVAPGSRALRFELVTLDAADAARGEMAQQVTDIIERLRFEYSDAIH
jgi:allophanate hydrolase subunit 2